MTSHNCEPVFLHGMWRSGSTYAWTRFRAAPGTFAYFEPLYPGLGRLTAARIWTADWRRTVAENHHPDMAAPYYAEYSELLRRWGRGVRGLRRRFAFDRFALAPDAEHPSLETYVRGLIEHARRRGARPVFGCNRTTLRVGWLRARFGGYHLHVERDPQSIWLSYARHAAEGNFSYFTNLYRIVERNAGHPLFAPLAERLWLRRGLGRLRKPRQAYPAAVTALSSAQSYGLVYHMWLLGALQALGCCDAVLDSGLAGGSAYAERMARDVKAGCGLDVAFTGLKRMPPVEPPFPSTARREIEAAVLDEVPVQALHLVGDVALARTRLSMFAPPKADVLGEAIVRLTHRRPVPAARRNEVTAPALVPGLTAQARLAAARGG